MEKLSSHPIEEIFSAFDRGKHKFAGASLRSSRVRNFRLHGIKCVKCGIKGTHFIIEKHKNDFSPHLNLYHISPNRYTLMTKDHIKPMSKGGMDCIHNLQPMCTKCNSRKSNGWNRYYKVQHLLSLIKHKINGQCKCSIKKALRNENHSSLGRAGSLGKKR